MSIKDTVRLEQLERSLQLMALQIGQLLARIEALEYEPEPKRRGRPPKETAND